MQKKINDEIIEYTIKNDFIQLSVINIGATITKIIFDGDNMVLSYDDYNDYLTNPLNKGSVIGRTAGRIKDASFMLNNKFYDILRNENRNNLHGSQLQLKKYDVKMTKDQIILSAIDDDTTYPGVLDYKVVYTLDGSSVRMEIIGSSNKDTIINMTNHSYFNLNKTGDILNHYLKINSDCVWYLDKDLIPYTKQKTDEVFNFKESTRILDRFKKHSQFDITRFLDHPFLLNDSDIILTNDDKTRELRIKTNQKYVVCYTGNFIDDANVLLNQQQAMRYQGICFETQMLPNAINTIGEQSDVIYPKDKQYYHKTIYSFSKIN